MPWEYAGYIHDLQYCSSNCYDDSAVDYSDPNYSPLDAYDGSGYVPVEYGVDYGIGSGGGQFIMTSNMEQITNMQQLMSDPESDVYTTVMTSYMAYYQSYLTYYAMSGYAMSEPYDTIEIMYLPQSEDDTVTVKFEAEAPAGWLGYCHNAGCNDG